MPLHPEPIIIAGMHRSGTSLTSRTCNLLGVDIGPDLIDAPPEENKESYWEPEALVEFHDRIFDIFHIRSDDLNLLPESWEQHPAIAPLRDSFINWLQQSFDHGDLWGLKDPRICRLLPVWPDIFNRLNLSPRFIIPFRHPMEVAGSLQKRNESLYPLERSLQWWLLNQLEVERHTRPYPRVFIYYPELVADWQSTMEHVANRLSITWPTTPENAKETIEQYIEPGRRHYKPDNTSLQELDVTGWVQQCFVILAQAAQGNSLDEAAMDDLHHRYRTLFRPIQCNLTEQHKLAKQTPFPLLLKRLIKKSSKMLPVLYTTYSSGGHPGI